MMKKVSAMFTALLLGSLLFAQEKVYLWPEKKGPGSEKLKIEQKEEERGGGNTHDRIISGITEPYMEVYRPSSDVTPKKTGILIIPGGAYQRVVVDKEGLHYVKLYTEAGYTCFVLVYRTPNDAHKDKSNVSLADAQRAMRIIRSNAQKYGLDPDKTGVLGSSAGGHVAASLAEYHAKEVYKQKDKADKGPDGKWTSARPAFQILLYPVITMQDNMCHEGSRTNLIGPQASQADKDYWSCEKNASSDTPVAWLAAAINDKSVLPETNVLSYWTALKNAGVRAELHIFPASGHGFGVMGASGTARDWPQLSMNWLKTYIDK
jgi:acetyl esterase/lipase